MSATGSMRQVIEEACRERGWSIARLAREAGIAPVGLCRALWLNNCYLSTLMLLCGALGLAPCDFDIRSMPGLRWTAKTPEGQRAQWLARLRGWRDADLAEHAGLTLGQMGAFMRGIVCPPTTIAAIEAALGERLCEK